jgi:hypothetical protein
LTTPCKRAILHRKQENLHKNIPNRLTPSSIGADMMK